MTRRVRMFSAGVLFALFACGLARADWTLVEERFYALSLADHPCGRSTERVERDGERIRTVSRIELRFVRLGQQTTVDLRSEFIENARGEAIEATVEQKGAGPVRCVFETQRRIRIVRNDTVEMRELGREDWLTPREATAFIAARGKSDAPEIRFVTLDVQSGFALTEITMARKGGVERTLEDRPVRLARYEVRNSLQPIVADELYDAAGLLVESTTPIGLGDLVSRLATAKEADAAYARANFDLLAGTFVGTKPIVGYLRRPSLAICVKSKSGDLADLPSTGAQRFERTSRDSAVVTVEIDRGSAADPGDDADPRWIKPNEIVDSDAAGVRELLASAALKPGMDADAKAEVLRRLVARQLVRKDLATAFGSASEAARERGGDCTEHAVLLAALLRAEGIPARVASGLVYVPEFGGRGAGWGWHLWTQALVGSDGARIWKDYDATLSGAGRGYHAAHIAVATSDLAGGATDPAFARAVSLIGAVTIEEIDPSPKRPEESAP